MNNVHLVTLQRGDPLRFTLAFRAKMGDRDHNCEDWLVDLADAEIFRMGIELDCDLWYHGG